MLVRLRRDPLQKEGSPLVGLVMAAPAIVIVAVFLLYPIAQTVVLSFHDWAGIGPRRFVGLSNYARALNDPIARLALWNNIVYSAGIIVLGVMTGLILASMLASNVRGRTVYQAIFFAPRLLTQVIVSIVWSWIYNPRFGIVNQLLRSVGLERFAIGWLGNPTWALPSVIVAASWTYFGFCMVIFLAAFGNTNPDLRDAAIMDGANGVQIFVHVIVPQIRHVIVMVMVYTVIDSFKVFDIVYIMTGGGPGDRTQILATYLYRESFRLHDFGYGATLAVILTIFVVGVAILFQRIRAEEV